MSETEFWTRLWLEERIRDRQAYYDATWKDQTDELAQCVKLQIQDALSGMRGALNPPPGWIENRRARGIKPKPQ